MTVNAMMDQRPQYSGAAHHPAATATATKTRHNGKATSTRANADTASNKNQKPPKPVQKQRSAPPSHSASAAVIHQNAPLAQPKKIAVHELFSMYASHSDGELSNSDSKNHMTAMMVVGKRPLVERQRAHTTARMPGTPPKTTTMGAFATPAYADSPSARELPPPPTDWLCLTANATAGHTTKPARAQTMPFTGAEFLRAIASQC
jgi:hypothetical protein